MIDLSKEEHQTLSCFSVDFRYVRSTWIKDHTAHRDAACRHERAFPRYALGWCLKGRGATLVGCSQGKERNTGGIRQMGSVSLKVELDAVHTCHVSSDPHGHCGEGLYFTIPCIFYKSKWCFFLKPQ